MISAFQVHPILSPSWEGTTKWAIGIASLIGYWYAREET